MQNTDRQRTFEELFAVLLLPSWCSLPSVRTRRGLNINLVLLADEEEDERDADAFRELGVSAKFDLVVQVARKVQNTLSALADNLEKLQK